MTFELETAGVVDARGLLCPMPIIKTTLAIKNVPVGAVLEVLTTDPGSKADLPAWARMTGNELLDLSEEAEKNSSQRLFRFFIRRLK
jgi:tRNA 2-thiouridine synthesizing protein A